MEKSLNSAVFLTSYDTTDRPSLPMSSVPGVFFLVVDIKAEKS